MALSDFKTAHHYCMKALALVQQGLLTGKPCSSEFCSRLYFLLAKASYSSGNNEEAQDLLKKIINEGDGLEAKKDAYLLLFTVRFPQLNCSFSAMSTHLQTIYLSIPLLDHAGF